MKKITSILLLVAVFATMFSLTAFAAGANTVTITTDKTAVATGDVVTVSVDISGDFLNVGVVQLPIKYDADKFSVDIEIDWDVEYEACWDYDWYDEINATAGKKLNLTRISAPSCGINPVGQFNVGYISTKGTTLTAANSTLASAGGTTTAAKVKFTALDDVDTIDASCFSIVESAMKVAEGDGTLHTLTINQIEASAPEFTPETIKGDVVEGDDANIVLPKSEGSANTHTYTNVATFKATLGAAVNYSEAGFIWVKDDVESEFKFVATDDEAVSGEGTFEYGVVMAGIPAEVDIDAIPYYITAE